MEVLFFILVLLIITFITVLKFKKNSLSKEAIKILKSNFKNSDFKKIKDFEDLKEQLEIKNNSKYTQSIQTILADAEHKIDILYNYRIKHKLPYNELSYLKVTANCVIDEAMKNELNLKESIKLLFLVLESPELGEMISEEETDNEFILNSFFKLLEGFVLRYNKRYEEFNV